MIARCVNDWILCVHDFGSYPQHMVSCRHLSRGTPITSDCDVILQAAKLESYHLYLRISIIIPHTQQSCCYTPHTTKLLGVYWFHYTPHTTKLLGGSILVSLRPSVRPASCVRSVASKVQDGFFPYLVQMINSMRGCVACDDPWPWPISSRSFGLDLENRVRSVAFTVLDGFFLYLAQMITIIKGCVTCYIFFRIWKFEFLANFWNFTALTLKKNLQFSMDSFHI